MSLSASFLYPLRPIRGLVDAPGFGPSSCAEQRDGATGVSIASLAHIHYAISKPVLRIHDRAIGLEIKGSAAAAASVTEIHGVRLSSEAVRRRRRLGGRQLELHDHRQVQASRSGEGQVSVHVVALL